MQVEIEFNHEVWRVCEICGEEYDARMTEHICDKISSLK